MVLNRKALAYTSKRPGKTQQFNYFSVNDKLDKKKEVKFGDQFPNQAPDSDSFYIVDLPGFGYAKVPEKQRLDWENFMRQVSERSERALGVFWTAFDKSLFKKMRPAEPAAVFKSGRLKPPYDEVTCKIQRIPLF